MPGPKKRLRGEKRVVVNLEPEDRAVLRTLAVENYAAGGEAGLASAMRLLIRKEAERRGLETASA